MASKLHLELALTPDGWRRDVVVRIDHGVIASVEEPGDGPAERLSGVVLPGLPNLHSHAFQRAMAGLTERRGSEADSFWTWREAMYRFVERLSPDDLEAIAAFAYMEMLEAGFTRVAEFHYLHHQPDGRPYDNVAEMSERIVAAADAAGIGLTLLPVLYRQSGFLGKPPTPAQRRFVCDRDLYARLMETRVPGGNIGIAPHSLRAVTLDDLQWAAAHLARPAGAHPRRRTDARGRGLPGRARQAADRSAARHDRGRRCRPLVPRPCHPRRRRRTGAHRQGQCRRRALPDHRSQSRRRPVRCVGVPGPGRPLRHRLGFPDPHLRRRRAAHPGIRPAADAPAAQRAGRGDALDRPAIVRGGAGRRRAGDGRDDDGRHQPRQARGFRGAGPRTIPRSPPRKDDSLLDAWLFAADNAAIKTVYCRGVPVVQNGRHVAREELSQRYRKALNGLA